MELSDILTLVKAGYTRNEIEQMESQAPADANTVPTIQPVENTAPVTEPDPAPANVPVAVPAPAPAEPTMADLMQSMAKLTSAIQANAIAQSVIPGGANQQLPTAEDMLAEIIRPTFKERG